MISSLNLLWILLRSWEPNSFMRQLGIGGISYPNNIETEGLVRSPPWTLEAFVWSWSLSWWLAEDAAKVFCRWIVHRYNIFDINNTGEMELTDSAKKLQIEMRRALA